LCEDMLRRKGAENLVEKANFDGAGSSSTGLAAVFDAISCVEGVVQLFAIDGYLVAEAYLEERVAKMAEIFAGGAGSVIGAVLRGIGGCGGPLNVGNDFGEVSEGWCLHDLEVLLVLRRSAGGHFVEPLSCMRFIEAAKTVEGGEELIVSADARAGHKGAHGESIDESIVELLVFEGVLGANIAFTTDGLRWDASGGGLWFEEAVRGGVDAEDICSAILDEGLSIDRAREMHVQVCSFWHAGEEGVELEWTFSCGVESFDGALFARRGGGGCLGSGRCG